MASNDVQQFVLSEISNNEAVAAFVQLESTFGLPHFSAFVLNHEAPC